MPQRVLFLLSSLLMAAWLWPSSAAAQVRRCAGADGGTVYTDRRCADIGGVERLQPTGPASTGGHNLYRGGCARNLQDLVYELTTAIDSHDANRLASVYHWTGLSSRQGYAVMARLDGVVKRPLVDIAPVMPASADGVDGDLYPQTTVRRAPVALRIEQTLANGSTPARSVFGLQKHFGCWWIRG
ncbi:MAG: hypothetical protein ACYC42_07225 [Lysobacter sp.]